MCSFLVCWRYYAYGCLIYVIQLLWYVVYVTSWLNWSLWKKGVSFNCFSISNQRIPARSAVELSASSASLQGLDRGNFCSKFTEVKIWHRSRARCAKARRSLRVAILRKRLKDWCCKGAQSLNFDIEACWRFSARSACKEFSWRDSEVESKLRRNRPSKFVGELHRGVALEAFDQVWETCGQLNKASWNKRLFKK